MVQRKSEWIQHKEILCLLTLPLFGRSRAEGGQGGVGAGGPLKCSFRTMYLSLPLPAPRTFIWKTDPGASWPHLILAIAVGTGLTSYGLEACSFSAQVTFFHHILSFKKDLERWQIDLCDQSD